MTIEAIAVLVRLTCLSKEQIFDVMNELSPEVSDEALEEMWKQRKQVVQ